MGWSRPVLMLLNGKFPHILGVAMVVLIGFGHWINHISSPLGQSPVLDARENLVWAERIAAGELPAEPFYRALGYPAVLAVLDRITGDAPLAVVASFFGLLLHWLNALMVGLIAFWVWENRMAGWLCGLLYGMYPVSLYFAVQLFDATLGIALFLGALLALFWRPHPKAGDGLDLEQGRGLLMGETPISRGGSGVESSRCGGQLAAGVVIGLAVLVRPHFLLPALALPLLILVAPWGRAVERCYRPRGRSGEAATAGSGSETIFSRMRQCEWSSAVRVALPLIGVLLAQGMLNFTVGGEFRVLPWQGAYNLYAANKTGADGRYFKQSLYFDELSPGQNPTRRESEVLFGRETGAEPPFNVDAMNRHWRDRSVEEVRADFPGWIGLMGKKAIYLFNNWEPYNNFTYAFHKERSAWLRWNPLGWGVLLALAAGGAMAGLHGRSGRRTIVLVLLVSLAYAVGLLIFFVSARFRLPLVPLLTIVAGGTVPLCREFWRTREPKMILGAFGVIAVAGVVAFPDWLNARDTSTFIQDEMLLATAAMQTGDDVVALEQSENVLARDPARPDATRLAIASRYNLLLTGTRENRLSEWRRLRALHGRLPAPDAVSDFIGGVAHWQTGDRDLAIRLWREQVRRHANDALSSAKALQVVGAESFFDGDDQEMLLLRRLLRGSEFPM